MFNHNLLLRIATIIVLLSHSIPGMFNNGIYEFGHYYLDQKGFAPVGVPVAWAIKLSHVAAALCFVFNRFIVAACLVTMVVLITGIFMVHLPDGWYVVGAGRNGIEFNILFLFVLIHLLYHEGLRRTKHRRHQHH